MEEMKLIKLGLKKMGESGSKILDEWHKKYGPSLELFGAYKNKNLHAPPTKEL